MAIASLWIFCELVFARFSSLGCLFYTESLFRVPLAEGNFTMRHCFTLD